MIAAESALSKLERSGSTMSLEQKEAKRKEIERTMRAMERELPRIDADHVLVKRMFRKADIKRNGKVTKGEFHSFILDHITMLRNAADWQTPVVD